MTQNNDTNSNISELKNKKFRFFLTKERKIIKFLACDCCVVRMTSKTKATTEHV